MYTQGFAPAFAKANAKALVLVARNESELEAAGREIKIINPKVQVLTQALDIRNKDAVKALYAKIQSDFGTVDILVNNAGIGTSALPIKDVDPEDFWYDFVSEIESMSAIIGCSGIDWTFTPRTLNTELTSSRRSTSKERCL